jgi:hypothetical protein
MTIVAESQLCIGFRVSEGGKEEPRKGAKFRIIFLRLLTLLLLTMASCSAAPWLQY